MSVLDTNVYNTSNTLSCKIDKTAPTASFSFSDTYNDVNATFYDNKSLASWNESCSGTDATDYANSNGTLNGTQSSAQVCNWGSVNSYGTSIVNVYDSAGNYSTYSIYHGYRINTGSVSKTH